MVTPTDGDAGFVVDDERDCLIGSLTPGQRVRFRVTSDAYDANWSALLTPIVSPIGPEGE